MPLTADMMTNIMWNMLKMNKIAKIAAAKTKPPTEHRERVEVTQKAKQKEKAEAAKKNNSTKTKAVAHEKEDKRKQL